MNNIMHSETEPRLFVRPLSSISRLEEKLKCSHIHDPQRPTLELDEEDEGLPRRPKAVNFIADSDACWTTAERSPKYENYENSSSVFDSELDDISEDWVSRYYESVFKWSHGTDNFRNRSYVK